ncbi:hypothetical protein HK105_207886 [Polyrhizophydium stewartii]|uniref:VWFD domain-containing protein n=1 Tax=Polyrhizophydium stewartii TaxID=2732419 RepID=A0ABR4MWD6_9FUNG|nr:hypothetical protein HK105_000351 [Polyrhizophydium stewartii]
MLSIWCVVLAASAAAAAAATPASPLVFSPSKIAIVDTKTSNSFGVRLAAKPKGPVSVFLQHPTIMFSRCSVQFDSANWNTTQTISVAPAPVIDKALSGTTVPFTIGALVAAPQDPFDGFNTTISGVRTPVPAASCSGAGDPHYKSFDGIAFTSFHRNYSFMVQSPELDVQVFTDSCFNGEATCHRGVAVRYGSSVMILDVRGAQRPLSSYGMAQLTPNVDNIHYTPPAAVNSSHVLKLPCGSTITVLFHYLATSTLDITIRLAAGYQATAGLCNRLPHVSSRLLVGADGVGYNATNRTQVGRFAATWAVPDDSNLFMGKIRRSAAPTASWGVQCELPSRPSEVIGKAASAASSSSAVPTASSLPAYVPVTTKEAGTKTTTATAATPRPTGEAVAINRTEIEQVCRDMFSVASCNELARPDFFVSACISDVTLTGTFEPTESLKRAYLAKCESDTAYTSKHPHADKAKRAHKAQHDLGFGNNTCVRGCSGHGVCVDFGCSCHSGWSGVDCSRDLSKHGGKRHIGSAAASRTPVIVVHSRTSSAQGSYQTNIPAQGGRKCKVPRTSRAAAATAATGSA